MVLIVSLYIIYIKIHNHVEYKCDIKKSEKWGGFCITKQHPNTGWNYILDYGLATKIGLIFKNKTIIDLGAGLGQYCEVIRNYSTCDAYDGSKNVEIVISIEVAEHIPKIYENIFEDNLIKCSKSIIILTWARIGQGGFYHVNERNKSEVINIFTSKGLKWNNTLFKLLFDSSRIKYIKNNLMVFSK